MNGSRNSTAQGNGFRDAIASLLRAAGYDVQIEHLLGGKAVDIFARKRIQFGSETLIVEAKDYKGNLPLEQTYRFIEQYGSLTRDRLANRALLVTRFDLTPDGKSAIESNPNALNHYTWHNLQREVFGAERYLAALVNEYEKSGLAHYYIKPKTTSGEDLTELIHNWIARPSAPPIVLIGSYGIGKSTFAQALAAELAARSQKDPSARIPILVRLGDIADENSIEGLFGRLLSARYRIENYHFETFLELNTLGRLVIILDGLDEMKHGMTYPAFQRQCNRFFELQQGDARLLLLGRLSAFPTEREFRAIVYGRITTATGTEVALSDRPPSQNVHIAEFTKSEGRLFVHDYFKWMSNSQRRDPNWTDQRIQLLQSLKFGHLIRRPIHAKMLCEIALDEAENIERIDVFLLYDKFITLLIHREIGKPGRYSAFGIPVRRAFNRAAAWWLQCNGRSASTTIADIPDSICERATRGIPHEFDSEGLKQELIKGCFVEKPGGQIYLEHQSIQDFLAAEFLFETVGSGQPEWPLQSVADVCAGGTAEIGNFLDQFFNSRPPGMKRAQEFSHQFSEYRGDLRDGEFVPFTRAFKVNQPVGYERTPWGFILNYKASGLAGSREGALRLLSHLRSRSTLLPIWLISAQQLAL